MVVGKIVGMLILWVGIAMYPFADDDDTSQTWHKFLQNLLDSYPIMIGGASYDLSIKEIIKNDCLFTVGA